MELTYNDFLPSLITSVITIISVLIIYFINFLIKKIRNKKTSSFPEIPDIVSFVLEAENKLGKGQGLAKLNYVLTKLGKKQKDNKAIKKINEVHSVLKTANDILLNEYENKKNNDGGE